MDYTEAPAFFLAILPTPPTLRHIDDELAVFVSYYAYEKEKEHYVGFLEDAKGFVGGK